MDDQEGEIDQIREEGESNVSDGEGEEWEGGEGGEEQPITPPPASTSPPPAVPSALPPPMPSPPPSHPASPQLSGSLPPDGPTGENRIMIIIIVKKNDKN